MLNTQLCAVCPKFRPFLHLPSVATNFQNAFASCSTRPPLENRVGVFSFIATFKTSVLLLFSIERVTDASRVFEVLRGLISLFSASFFILIALLSRFYLCVILCSYTRTRLKAVVLFCRYRIVSGFCLFRRAFLNFNAARSFCRIDKPFQNFNVVRSLNRKS